MPAPQPPPQLGLSFQTGKKKNFELSQNKGGKFGKGVKED